LAQARAPPARACRGVVRSPPLRVGMSIYAAPTMAASYAAPTASAAPRLPASVVRGGTAPLMPPSIAATPRSSASSPWSASPASSFAVPSRSPTASFATGPAPKATALAPARAEFQLGEQVEARWGSSDSWFPATVAKSNGDGTFMVDWQDGNTHGRTKRTEDLRRRGAVGGSVVGATATAGSHSVRSGGASSANVGFGLDVGNAPPLHQRISSEACSTPGPMTASPTSRGSFQVGSASPEISQAREPALATEAQAQASVAKHTAPEPAAPATPSQAQPLPRMAAAPEQLPPAATATSESVVEAVATGQEEETKARPQPREDVKCFQVELADGERCVVVQRAVDGKRWRFDRKSIHFELFCDAASLSTWLDGITNQQMPGLLTLLANEVTERGAQLKDVEKERDALRGTEDYDFFGLDGTECSDKDIERAYRKKSQQLHPDKGGDENSFNDMRKKYEQLKELRGDGRRKEGGGGSIKWDPNVRDSMLTAHEDLRAQLIWITKHKEEVDQCVEELRRKQQIRHTLTWDQQAEALQPLHTN